MLFWRLSMINSIAAIIVKKGFVVSGLLSSYVFASVPLYSNFN